MIASRSLTDKTHHLKYQSSTNSHHKNSKKKKKEEVHPIHFKVIVEEWMSISHEGHSQSINQRVQYNNNIRIKTFDWNAFINAVY